MKTTKLIFTKSVSKTNEYTIMETSDRYLNCELTVKGNNAEEVAHTIMLIMERELMNNGYDFQFSGCPVIEDGEYCDCISIAFESGYMTEYKEALKESYRVAKAELKENKEVKAETKEDSQKVQEVAEVQEVEEMEVEEITPVQQYYHIWNGTEDLKGSTLKEGQQVRIDLYNMDIEELEELKGVDYREIQEGYCEKNYTRIYIEIVAVYPIHDGLEELFVNEIYHAHKGWIEQKKFYNLYQIQELFNGGMYTTINVKEMGERYSKDYNYTNFNLYYPIETK